MQFSDRDEGRARYIAGPDAWFHDRGEGNCRFWNRYEDRRIDPFREWQDCYLRLGNEFGWNFGWFVLYHLVVGNRIVWIVGWHRVFPVIWDQVTFVIRKSRWANQGENSYTYHERQNFHFSQPTWPDILVFVAMHFTGLRSMWIIEPRAILWGIWVTSGSWEVWVLAWAPVYLVPYTTLELGWSGSM